MNVLEKWNPFRFERPATKDVAKREDPPSETLRHPMRSFEEEMNRMVERLWKEPFPGFADLSPWFGDFRPTVFKPHLDVTDEGDRLEVTAELPGMDKEDVEITFEDGVLVLKGEKKHEEEKKEKGCYRLERSYGRFQRNIPLPADVDVEHGEATFDKGVLKIRFTKLPKPAAKAKKIEIRS